MVRWCALTLAAFALIGVAWAQTTETYSLGRKDVGETHTSRLTARNANCRQPLDIRFEFAQSAWLRPEGENVVRGVPAGESRALPIVIDLTQMQPGTHTAQVDVVCENCRGLIFANCRFDRQRLILTVEATAPAPVAPARPTRPPTRTPTPEAPPQTVEPTPPVTTPAPAPVIEPAPAVACDCTASVQMWQGAAAVGGVLALLGVGWGAMSSASASAARRALEEGARGGREMKGPQSSELVKKALERKLDQAEIDLDRANDDLAALAQAQAQAMRVLSALGEANASGEADTWTARASGAGLFVNEAAGRVVPDRGEGRLKRVIEGARGKHSGAPLATSAPERARMDWLIAHGFAFSDTEARALLGEMANWRAKHGMSDMIARLQAKIEARGRAEGAVRALKAQVAAMELGG